MKYLLDTHVLLWATANEDMLSDDVLQKLNNPDNEIYYSSAAIWEIMIKHIKHPNKVPLDGEQLAEFCEEAEFIELPVRKEHTFMLKTLRQSGVAQSHADPFDRIMLSQAKAENMIFITHDGLLKGYHEPCVMTV